MKKVSKIIEVGIIFLFIVLECVIVIYPEIVGHASTKPFKVELYFEDDREVSNYSKKGIKIDVYSSQITKEYREYDMTEYTHSFAFSVYSDENGMVTFEKPSTEFLIMVDEASLPFGTGVEAHTKFYHTEDEEDKIEISEIDYVDVNYDENSDNNIVVKIYNRAGKRITAHYTISEEKTTKEISQFISDGKKEIKGKVLVGEKVIPYEYEINYSHDQIITLIKEAEATGDITKVEALQEYLNILYEIGESTELYSCISSLKNDIAFFNSLSESKQREINQVLAAPYYNNTFSSGRFEIRYVSASSSVPVFIYSLMLALQAADTSLCGGLSFNQPRSNSTGTAKYYVYVTSDSNGNAAGTCRSETSSGIRVSYITLWQISNLDYSLTDFEKGVVSHEYMHAIVHDYRDNSALPKWFKESWSEWAIVRVNGLSANTCPVNLVNGYLENSHKSLIDDDDSYGKLLYPLYIKQNYGGDSTVSNVVKNLAYTSDVYIAIDNALTGSNTFDLIFPEYMRHIYKPKLLFNPYLNNWNNHAHLSADYSLYSYPNNELCFGLYKISAHYREFAVPSAPYHLDITINLVLSDPTISGKLLMTGSSGTITNWNFTTSGSLVTYSTNINTTYVKGCVMLVSANHSSSTYYNLTIARS